ncbi:MAG: sensor histidine kinase [Chthoniobacterales bacterium]
MSGWAAGRLRTATLVDHTTRVAVVVLALSWIALVGLLDYWTGPEHTMLVVYLIPITLGVWCVGRDFGLLLAVLSIATSSIADLAAGLPQVRYWNEALGLISYVVFVSLLAGWRALLNELDDRVRARTAALEKEISARTKLQNELSELTERERRRLGHDLHDSICQHLTGTALSAQILWSHLTTASKPEADEAKKIVELIEQGIDLTRNLARGLFSPDVDGSDLTLALENLAHATRERFGVECEFQEDARLARQLPRGVSTQLYRIAQEAVANAGKHAAPDRIIIELDQEEAELSLNVFDNGIGFDPADSQVGLGLRMMRHGAEAIGASFSIRRNRAGGSVVSCTVETSGERA